MLSLLAQYLGAEKDTPKKCAIWFANPGSAGDIRTHSNDAVCRSCEINCLIWRWTDDRLREELFVGARQFGSWSHTDVSPQLSEGVGSDSSFASEQNWLALHT